MKLKEKYEKIANKYCHKFAKKHDLQFDFWVVNQIGGIVCMSDYFFDFEDIRYFINEKTSWEIISNWYDFCIDFGYITKETYIKLLANFKQKKGFAFNYKNFHEWLKIQGFARGEKKLRKIQKKVDISKC